MTFDDHSLAACLARAEKIAKSFSRDEIMALLALSRKDEIAKLFETARAVKQRVCGKGIAVRGLIEAGNICAKNCFYCGIRRENKSVARYQLSSDEIFATAQEAKNLGYDSIVIQSGEIESDAHTRAIEEILLRLRPLDLGITLSLGEQTKDVYARWRAAGATRYLLRIETSNREFYAQLHPSDCSWTRRVACLHDLRACDYQVGTGVMIGVPGQSIADLADDLLFFGETDVDMIGMGPYVPHAASPLATRACASDDERLQLALKMLAITRLYLHDINLASATALDVLARDGRLRGILAGANVLMPNVTATRYRENYQLYDGKPGANENARAHREKIDDALAKIGEELLYHQRGDSRHYARLHSRD